MKDKAQAIVDDFLRSTNPAHRRNALTFLRVVGDPESVQLLVNQAVGKDDVLREAAAAELALLTAEARDNAISELNRIVMGPDRSRALYAYALIGTLGESVKSAHFVSKLRLAWALHRLVFSRKGFGYYLRAALWSLLSAAVAGTVLLLYLRLLDLSDSNTVEEVFATALISALVAGPLLVLRTSPFAVHPDRFVGMVLEGGLPVVSVALATCAIWALAYLSGPLKEVPDRLWWLWVACGSLCSACLAIRLGSAFSHGAVRSPKGDFLISAAVGGSLGSLVFTGLLLLNRHGHSTEYWPAMVVACFGLAGAFAGIDGRAPALKRPRSQTIPRFTSAVVMLALAVACLTPLVGGPARINLTQEMPADIELRSLPQLVPFYISQKSHVLFGAQDSAPARSVALTDALDKEIQSSEEPPYLEAELEPGLYRAKVSLRYDSSIPMKIVFPAVLDRVRFLRSSNGSHEIARLALATNKDQTYKPGDSQPLPDSATVAVPQLPFVYFFTAPKEQRHIHVSMEEEITSGKSFEFRIYHDSKIVSNSQDFITHGGQYMIAVEDSKSKEARIDEKALAASEIQMETTTILPGAKLTFRVEPENPDYYLPDGSNVTILGRGPQSQTILIQRMPFVHFLKVETNQRVHLDLPSPPGGADYILSLYDQDGGLVKDADDPESITEVLASGTYWIYASPYTPKEDKPPGSVMNGFTVQDAHVVPKGANVRLVIHN